MPSVEEVGALVEEMCAQHSSNIAMLQEQKEKIERHHADIERQMRDENERLRVGNQLREILVQDRERREGAMKAPTINNAETSYEKYAREAGDALSMPSKSY